MNFAYKADGGVTGYNRKATEGTDEITGTCTPQDWTVLPQKYNSDVRCYKEVSGKLVGNTPDEMVIFLANELKEDTLKEGLTKVDKDVADAQKVTFEYNGNTFYADERSILAAFSALAYQPEDYSKVWKTAEKEADGLSNIYVTLDKTGIAGLALALLGRQAALWDAGDQVKKQLKLDYNN